MVYHFNWRSLLSTIMPSLLLDPADDFLLRRSKQHILFQDTVLVDAMFCIGQSTSNASLIGRIPVKRMQHIKKKVGLEHEYLTASISCVNDSGRAVNHAVLQIERNLNKDTLSYFKDDIPLAQPDLAQLELAASTSPLDQPRFPVEGVDAVDGDDPSLPPISELDTNPLYPQAIPSRSSSIVSGGPPATMSTPAQAIPPLQPDTPNATDDDSDNRPPSIPPTSIPQARSASSSSSPIAVRPQATMSLFERTKLKCQDSFGSGRGSARDTIKVFHLKELPVDDDCVVVAEMTFEGDDFFVEDLATIFDTASKSSRSYNITSTMCYWLASSIWAIVESEKATLFKITTHPGNEAMIAANLESQKLKRHLGFKAVLPMEQTVPGLIKAYRINWISTQESLLHAKEEASKQLRLEQTASDALAKVKEVEESKKEALAVSARALEDAEQSKKEALAVSARALEYAEQSKKEALEAAEKKYHLLELEMSALKSNARTSEVT